MTITMWYNLKAGMVILNHYSFCQVLFLTIWDLTCIPYKFEDWFLLFLKTDEDSHWNSKFYLETYVYPSTSHRQDRPYIGQKVIRLSLFPNLSTESLAWPLEIVSLAYISTIAWNLSWDHLFGFLVISLALSFYLIWNALH